MTPPMDVLVETQIDEPGWQAVDLEALARRTAPAVLAHLGLTGAYEVSVLGCGDDRIAALNAAYRGTQAPTNVLSWPADALGAEQDGAPPMPVRRHDPDGRHGLGDVALALQTCAREANDAGRSLADHTRHLLVHGLLHLLGYDHDRPRDAELMEALERRILAEMGVSDPYLQSRSPRPV